MDSGFDSILGIVPLSDQENKLLYKKGFSMETEKIYMNPSVIDLTV